MTAQPEFDAFLRRGPANDDPVHGLAELRYKILIDGIPSNSDGMVSCISILIMSRGCLTN